MEIRQPFANRQPPRRNRLLTATRPVARPAPWKARVLPVALLLAGISFGVLVFPYLERQVNQPVARVLVKGDLQYVDRRELMNYVPVFLGDHLLDVNLDAVRKTVQSMPWIYSVQVTRQWPDTISIEVVEQKPIAYWNDSKLLNQYGDVFLRQGKAVVGLPALSGVEGGQMNVAQRFLEFSRLLLPLGMKIVRLQQDEQLAWEVDTDNGIHIQLGDNRILDKMRRFVFLYQSQLQQDARHIQAVDLRYTSGAAVRWGSDT